MIISKQFLLNLFSNSSYILSSFFVYFFSYCLTHISCCPRIAQFQKTANVSPKWAYQLIVRLPFNAHIRKLHTESFCLPMQLMSSSLQFCSPLLLPLAHNVCIIKSFICHSNHACPSSFPALRRAQRYSCKKINGAGNWSAPLFCCTCTGQNRAHQREAQNRDMWTITPSPLNQVFQAALEEMRGGLFSPLFFCPKLRQIYCLYLQLGEKRRKWKNSLWIILNEPLNDKCYYTPDLIFVIRLSGKGKM